MAVFGPDHSRAIAALLPALTPAFAGWTEEELADFWQYLDRLKTYLDDNR